MPFWCDRSSQLTKLGQLTWSPSYVLYQGCSIYLNNCTSSETDVVIFTHIFQPFQCCKLGTIVLSVSLGLASLKITYIKKGAYDSFLCWFKYRSIRAIPSHSHGQELLCSGTDLAICSRLPFPPQPGEYAVQLIYIYIVFVAWIRAVWSPKSTRSFDVQ